MSRPAHSKSRVGECFGDLALIDLISQQREFIFEQSICGNGHSFVVTDDLSNMKFSSSLESYRTIHALMPSVPQRGASNGYRLSWTKDLAPEMHVINSRAGFPLFR